MTTSDTGGKVQFPAQNERTQFQNEHCFRLRHQYHFWGFVLACSAGSLSILLKESVTSTHSALEAAKRPETPDICEEEPSAERAEPSRSWLIHDQVSYVQKVGRSVGKSASDSEGTGCSRDVENTVTLTQRPPTIDAVELARTSIHRWLAQENVIKDDFLPLGLDTNHGFAKVAVANLAMWVRVRDQDFPVSHAQATWKRLRPFFQLPGTTTHPERTGAG